jgi:hypothetical protein
VKASLNRALGEGERPEAERACPGQGEGEGNLPGGPNPWVVQYPGTSWGKE